MKNTASECSRDVPDFLGGHIRIKADGFGAGAEGGIVGPRTVPVRFSPAMATVSPRPQAQAYQPQGKTPDMLVHVVPGVLLPHPPDFLRRMYTRSPQRSLPILKYLGMVSRLDRWIPPVVPAMPYSPVGSFFTKVGLDDARIHPDFFGLPLGNDVAPLQNGHAGRKCP